MSVPTPSESISSLPTSEVAAISKTITQPIDPTALLIDHLADVAAALAAQQAELQRIYAMAVGISQPEMVSLIRNHIAALLAGVAQDAHHCNQLAPTITALAQLAQARPVVPSLISNAPAAWMNDVTKADTHPNANESEAV